MIEVPTWVPTGLNMLLVLANVGLIVWARRSAVAAKRSAEAAEGHLSEARRAADTAELHLQQARRAADAAEESAAAASSSAQANKEVARAQMAAWEQTQVDLIEEKLKLGRPDEVRAFLEAMPSDLKSKRCELLKRALAQSRNSAHFRETSYLKKFFPECAEE